MRLVPERTEEEEVTDKKTLGANLADAISSIQGQLAQLEQEVTGTAKDRVKSISNALKEITPA